MVCKGCGRHCSQEDSAGLSIACIGCDETGVGIDGKECGMCGGIGSIDLPGCPRDYVGRELTDAINLASFAGKGAMPVSGGLLDQSAWFVDLWQTLESDQNRIDAEKAQDRKRGK